MKIGDRMYHAIFGWCKITHPPLYDKVLVDLDADTIEYYVMRKGYVKYERDKESGQHILFTPISDLFQTQEDAAKSEIHNLKKAAYNPTITFKTETK